MKRIAVGVLVHIALFSAAVSVNGATRPKFRPATPIGAGEGRYVVTLVEDAAVDDPAALRQELALIYGAKLEPNASSDAHRFAATMTAVRARLLSADPRVIEVVEVPPTTPPPSQTPASSAHLKSRPTGYGDNGQSGTYTYDGAGNITAIGADTYVYDSSQRLVSSVTRGVQENYTYDAYGNRTSATGAVNCLGQTNCAQTVTVDSNTNHLTAINGATVTYDVAGNISTIAATSTTPGAIYTYDALGRMTRATVGSDDRQFLYNADDERIAVRQGVSWTWMMRDQSGKVLREFTSLESGSGPTLAMTNWQWAKDYVWRDGLLLATVSPSGTLHYHLDHLGTPRLVTDANGVKVAEHAYYPFGAEINLTPYENPEEAMKFTGHERDIVAGDGRTLDYMHARYYTGSIGRFLSVDPLLHADRALHSPQMWNRYAYAIDNPMVFTDPTGTTVYLVTYTTGNSEGDDEFRRAAQTRAAEIQHQKGYDAKHDTVIVAGVQTKADFAAAVKQANGMFKQFGKVGEVDLYSHSGSGAGPVFHNAAGKSTQFSGQELRGIQVNWASGGCAKFFGCNTGMNFSQAFATAQHVNAYGQPGYAYFSGSPAERIPIAPSGPVYLISAPGFHNPGPMGLGWLAYAAGDAYADPMVNSHP